MKNKILVVLFIALFSFNLDAQINQGILTYEVETVFGTSWEDKLQACKSDSLKYEQEKKKIEVFLEKHNSAKFRNKTETSQRRYHFTDRKTRIFGNKTFKGKTYEVYFHNHLEKEIRWISKESLKVDTFFFADSPLDKTYELFIKKDSIKNILGYDCHLILMKEFRGSKEWVVNYEMYVTDQIDFPPNIMFEWSKEIVKGCALEVMEWTGEEKRNYNTYKAINFDKNLDESIFDIPKQLSTF